MTYQPGRVWCIQVKVMQLNIGISDLVSSLPVLYVDCTSVPESVKHAVADDK